MSPQASFDKITATVLSKSHDYLRRNSTAGSWSYHPGATPSMEATAWSAIALRADPEVRRQSADYLMKVQHSDGGWSSDGSGTSDWNSTLALLSLRLLSDPQNLALEATSGDNNVHKAVDFLFDQKTVFYSPTAAVIVSILKGSEFLKYPQGWPWTRDTFHWAEPTSYALLALRPLVAKDKKGLESLQRADAFLIEKACVGGGWNTGANKVLGFNAPPYPVTSAQALCALQQSAQNPTVQASLAYLNKVADQQHTVMALSWSVLARDLFGEDTEAQRQRLAALQNPDGSFGNNILLTALATCAIDVADNPLRLPAKV